MALEQWLNPNNFAILRDKFNAVVTALTGGTENQLIAKNSSDAGDFKFAGLLDLLPTGQPWDTYETDLSLSPFNNNWIARDGKTLGSSSSTADLKGDAYRPLFDFLWNKFANTECPVTGGRGSDADADWTANKKIQLMDDRGVFGVGYDNRSTDPANGIWDADYNVIGRLTGEKDHVLTDSEAAQKDLGDVEVRVQLNASGIGGAGTGVGNATNTPSYSEVGFVNIPGADADTGHNNIPPARVINKIIKL